MYDAVDGFAPGVVLLPVVTRLTLSTVFVGQSSLMCGAVDGFAPRVVLLPVVSTHSSSDGFVR